MKSLNNWPPLKHQPLATILTRQSMKRICHADNKRDCFKTIALSKEMGVLNRNCWKKGLHLLLHWQTGAIQSNSCEVGIPFSTSQNLHLSRKFQKDLTDFNNSISKNILVQRFAFSTKYEALELLAFLAKYKFCFGFVYAGNSQFQ